jgi:hypothetical protein
MSLIVDRRFGRIVRNEIELKKEELLYTTFFIESSEYYTPVVEIILGSGAGSS